MKGSILKIILNLREIKKSDTFIFVSLMNLLPNKDYFTIFKALKLLKNNGINFNYYIIDNGPIKKY